MNVFEQMGQARLLANEGNVQLAAGMAKGVRKQLRKITRLLREALIAVSRETSFQLQTRPVRAVPKDQGGHN